MTTASKHTRIAPDAEMPEQHAQHAGHPNDDGIRPPSAISPDDARFSATAREARLLGRSNTQTPGWQGIVSRNIGNAGDDALGTFIAGQAALSHPDAPQEYPDETLAQRIADAEEEETRRTRADARHRRGMLLGTAAAALPFAFATAYVLTSNRITMLITLAVPIQAICAAISVVAMTAFCLGVLDRRMRRKGTKAGLGSAAFSLCAGTMLGACTFGLPPLTALCCWLAANEAADSLAISDGERGPVGFRRYVNRMRIERESREAPPFVAEARRLASELESSEPWVANVAAIVRQASNDDLGTMVAAYAALADEASHILDEAAIDEAEPASAPESRSDANQNDGAIGQPQARRPHRGEEAEPEIMPIPEDVVRRRVLRAGWIAGLFIGVLGAYNWYATLGQFLLNPTIPVFICAAIAVAGMTAGRRRAGIFSRAEGGLQPGAYLSAVSCICWSAFWTVFFLQLACFYLGVFSLAA